MFAEKLILFFAAIFLLQQNVFGFNEPRIVNGSATPDGVYEFLPKLILFQHGHSLNMGKNLFTTVCSATIISKRHILTAAHCVNTAQRLRKSNAQIWNHRVQGILLEYRPSGIGDFYIKNVSMQTRYYFHPSYTKVHTLFADIAIIELPEDTEITIPPITLASNYVEKEGDTAMAAGYGVYKWKYDETIGEQVPEHPKVLQNATVPIVLNCAVTDDYQNTTICAGNYKVHADEGDSGGPLMIERNGTLYQVGVLSMGLPFGPTHHDVHYTRVSTFCDWISMITKGQAKCKPLPDEPKPPQPINPNDNVTPKHSDPEAQSGNSSIGFSFNILLFFFIGIFYFA